MAQKYLTIDGKRVAFENERNVLEVIRKTNVDIPTFCYHSELSVYGACRLCLVDIQGMGIQPACSTQPRDGMVVKTTTSEIREIRKVTIELLLASYNHDCTTCSKSTDCKLQDIARKLGVTEVRFKKSEKQMPIDRSSHSLVRDPNKCILCGDCVRACEEIQGIGAIDFVHRGSNVSVLPAFGKDLAKVDCIDCGQCARVCPTGAIVPKSQVRAVWSEIDNKEKVVVAQIAPAVRVAIGEMFGMKPGRVLTGQIVAALKLMGFDRVYDTAFTADLTIFEEANELLGRMQNGGNMPLMTSCCPGWVKYMEQYYPEMLDNLSTCKSPQQMFGSVAKSVLPESLNVSRKNLIVVSIMPCTAKKFEAQRPEFIEEGVRDVDYVITTQELAAMIKEAGIKFNKLSPEALDIPFGFKTGAGVIFGNSGGVSEAALRYLYEKVNGVRLDNIDFEEIRGNAGIREATIELGGKKVQLAIANGLKNAGKLIESVKSGEKHYDFIEVMACPGGCIGGAGQPVQYDEDSRKARTEGLYEADKMVQLHKSQDNPYIKDLYANHLGEIGGEAAHHLLHTNYKSRKRILGDGLAILDGKESKIDISVCVGTNCYLKGSQNLIRQLIHYIEDKKLKDVVNVRANFCMEKCDEGPGVTIGKNVLKHCTLTKAIETLELELAELKK